MRRGKLRFRGELQSPSAARNDSGQLVPTWATVARDLPCSLEDSGGGSEVQREDQREAIGRATWRINYRSGVTPAMRFVVDSVNWHIDEVNDPTHRKRYLDLVCRVTR